MKGWKPYRATNDNIAGELERFEKARKLIADGKLEEARKICWWPKNEEPPDHHWSQKGVHICYCGKNSADGVYALCAYCGGTTTKTPSLVIRRRPIG